MFAFLTIAETDYIPVNNPSQTEGAELGAVLCRLPHQQWSSRPLPEEPGVCGCVVQGISVYSFGHILPLLRTVGG